MTKKEALQLFEEKKIRSVWDDKEEKWYFSIVDVCAALTDQPDTEHARNYWKVLKHRLVREGNETVTTCNRLSGKAARNQLESKLGHKVISPAKASDYLPPSDDSKNNEEQ